MSKFHAWNIKVGACIGLWTFLKKIFKFRKSLYGEEGSKDKEVKESTDTTNTGDKTTGTVEQMVAHLKALQKGKHTLELACCIFSDQRVRGLGYMLLI